MKLRLAISWMVLWAFIALPVVQTHAQGNNPNECRQFVRRAYSDLGTNCLKLEANTACYGYQDVTGMLVEGQVEEDDFFAEPGYRTGITDLARVAGSPFDLEEEIWGLYRLHIQVYTDDIEDDDLTTLEDNMRDVLYVGLGDVTVEDALMPNVNEEGELVIDAENHGPMQPSYLRNGYTAPVCEEAPAPLLLIQGADDADTTITVNGLKIKLHAGSMKRPLPTTIVLQVLAPGDSMRVIVLAGLATLNPDTNSELPVAPGHWVIVCLDPPQDRGLDGEENDQIVSCPASAPAQLTRGMIDELKGLNDLPGNVLKKPVIMPSVTTASGVGGTVSKMIFQDLEALELARQACNSGELSQPVCVRIFG